MTRGPDAGPVGAVDGVPEAPPDDTGEALGLSARRLTLTFGVGPALFATPTGATVRPRRRPPAALARPAALRGRRARPGAQRRRPLRPGLRRRPAGRLPRRAQPGAHRRSAPCDALVAARLRPHVVHVERAGDAAQPHGLQGRHRQRHGRGRRPASRARVGRPRDGPAWMAGGTYLVARRIRMHDRDLGPRALADQEAVFGRDKGERRAAHRRRRVRRARLRGAGRDGRRHRRRRPRAARAPGAERRRADAAPRLLLRRRHRRLGRLDAGLFFLAFCRDPRPAQYVPLQAKPLPGRRDGGVPRAHRIGTLGRSAGRPGGGVLGPGPPWRADRVPRGGSRLDPTPWSLGKACLRDHRLRRSRRPRPAVPVPPPPPPSSPSSRSPGARASPST